MLKVELIEKALEEVRCRYGRFMNLPDMNAALDSLCGVAVAELLGGGEVHLPGLGKLKIRETAACERRNPRTRESLHVPAGKKVFFVPAKNLKDALKA